MYSLGTVELVDPEVEVYDNENGYDDSRFDQRAETDDEGGSYAIGSDASSNSGFTLLEVIDTKLEWIFARSTVPLSTEELLRFPAGYRDFAWPLTVFSASIGWGLVLSHAKLY
ncbi:hypothetical protein WOLCODRAFT_24514 [Wolfiporia cocos MD-104 SS10]|uniref:Uncharacterized protein n=1 Tax=Wolfiporia cocos (strain MD-104) TaxID=742152 RepID=A0A2H3JML8_WOLCO|nr:hypothetical protein WOLCODRAFT_24514 [Wolfiporia cocos MD-104 SS10]